MAERPLPKPQKDRPRSAFESMATGYGFLFEQINESLGINPDTITTITEFGCGQGAATTALLRTYQDSHIHALDYHRILNPEVASDPRVDFYQGLFVDLLRSGLPPAQISVLGAMSMDHGFDRETVKLLKQYTRGQLLVTYGDNAGLEQTDWFKKSFTLISEDRGLIYATWRSE